MLMWRRVKVEGHSETELVRVVLQKIFCLQLVESRGGQCLNILGKQDFLQHDLCTCHHMKGGNEKP